MVIGHYVRCPIVLEENDNYFPRSFVLAKIIQINELSGEVRVKMFDLKNSRRFYAHAFDKLDYPMDKVDRCGAAKDAPVNTPDGPGQILSRRLEKKDEAFYEYFVMLHNGKIRTYLENELEIEYSAADYQPIKQMMRYEFQNPSWFANRLQVSGNMHMVNNTVYGFKELVGCRTFLMAHQISTIVRAFESRPIRYMLADEVGLGKTIEACSIIKILSTEKKNLRVLYIVPGALAQQWVNELRYKFEISATLNTGIAGYTNHVIVAMEDLDEYNEVLAYQWDLLIVDETHRLLSQEEKYELVLNISKATLNALFLSATPIQNRREEYLRLLTLLQPEQYGRMELSTFSSLLSKQKKIQRRVNGLISHMNNYEDWKEDSLEKLEELAEELSDEHLFGIVKGIDFQSKDMGKAAMEQSLSYISENYRIERNIVRNRRDFVTEILGERVLHALPYRMKSSEDGYSERNVYFALLEYISTELSNESMPMQRVIQLLQAMFSSPWALKAVISNSGETDNNLEALVNLWVMQAEDELANTDYLMDEAPEEIKGRLLYALDFMEQEVSVSKDNNGKVVVFSEYPETLWKFGELLSKRGIESVCFTGNMLRNELEDSVYEFQNNENCRVILCDVTGGEGRNFQNADWVFHLDLPWTANAIEQRIGRLDRLGRDKDHLTVNSVVFYSEESIESQLFTIWNKGLDLFQRSLSGLEIITGELNERITEALEDDIYNGLENALDDIVEMTEDTRDAVEEEQLYDSGSVIYRPLSIAVKQMLSTYSGGENDLFKASMLGWATQAGLRSTINKNDIVQFSDAMFSPRAAIQSLFIPPDWSLYDNTEIVRKEGKILGTFDRSTAIKREDLIFYAPGDPVFNSIIGNALDNGRGRCCAFATHAPFDFKGFVCIYNIEPRINYLMEKKISIQLLSQFRMYLPMKQVIVYVPFSGSEKVSEKDLNDFLFDVKNIRDAEHLGKRSAKKGTMSELESFMEIHPETEWKNTITRVSKLSREKAVKKVQELSDFETAKREISRIVSGYESEYIYLGRDMSRIEKIKERYEAVYYALSNPILSLDSIALMYLTSR